jgi:phospholipid transport system substrate-binding protein
MKRTNRKACVGAVAALLLVLAPAMGLAAQPAVDNSTPQKLVESAATALLADLDANRAGYRQDLAALYRMIDTKFLPHVDVQFAAQNVLGKHWRSATPEQRKRFIDAFTYSLQTTYGAALLDFTGDNLRIKPFRGDAAADRASVDTEIRRANGAVVQVAFGVRRNDAGGWKVWDVVIEGISYVKSFREDYGLQIEQKGLEALLKRLEDGKLAAK